ncbi:MAG: cytochrome C [Magnetococcales bacterium]|nr:cytochrome C [Magnetococcales bacterium]
MRRLAVLAVALLLTGGAWASDKADEGGKKGGGAARVPDTRYVKECGSCHVPYPPHTLSPLGWQKLMGNLANHFGDNAELADADRMPLTSYLMQNASRGKGIDEVTRITELAGFTKEHNKIPARLVKDNPGVKSLAQCQACHPRAAQWAFGEREIVIPGHGRWE